MDELEPLVRRARNQSGRSALLAVRMAASSLAAIDQRAEKWGMTRADAVRLILSAGIEKLDHDTEEHDERPTDQQQTDPSASGATGHRPQ